MERVNEVGCEVVSGGLEGLLSCDHGVLRCLGEQDELADILKRTDAPNFLSPDYDEKAGLMAARVVYFVSGSWQMGCLGVIG